MRRADRSTGRGSRGRGRFDQRWRRRRRPRSRARRRAPLCAGRIRDLKNSQPDFDEFLGDDRGIVARELGADHTPVYAGHPTTPTTTGAADFHDWYHDVPGVNVGEPFTLPLAGDATSFHFENDSFFPLDGQLLGDEGQDHNYSFTLELHGTFVYAGGESFALAGDDDLWLFVDGRLAVDLGGVHSTEEGQVSVDALATALGLETAREISKSTSSSPSATPSARR